MLIFSSTGWNQFTIDSNFKCSSRTTAFLGYTRNNIHILFNTQVTSITSVGPNDMDFQVAKVSFSVNSISKRIIAEKNVIVTNSSP